MALSCEDAQRMPVLNGCSRSYIRVYCRAHIYVDGCSRWLAHRNSLPTCCGLVCNDGALRDEDFEGGDPPAFHGRGEDPGLHHLGGGQDQRGPSGSLGPGAI